MVYGPGAMVVRAWYIEKPLKKKCLFALNAIIIFGYQVKTD
ncbi:MAG: hypothetical protein JETT_0890 [Candidatus Jettenia ecosi]|uniref:Uncharacterized protein n=1 Tax=Candidatus Jettenia ecosi TaxID=2494326 RepID=A0A533QDC5_9BACT|nr:MAG: hypothetical protein JETT_0890 [Candidatus Jettenia ecosi]